MYFIIEQEYNAMDLIDTLINQADTTTKTILELSQEYQLEECLLDVVDKNIGEHVAPYEIIQDIDENPQEYIKALLDNVDEDYREDLEEELQEL
jgi:hypothetical protein